MNYPDIHITTSQAEKITLDLFGINAKASPLAGEVDFNFKILAEDKTYILKVCRPDVDADYIDYQQAILDHVAKNKNIVAPRVVLDKNNHAISTYIDANNNPRKVRLLTWISGDLWASVHPKDNSLLFSLGQKAATLTNALLGFDHAMAHREFAWDVAKTPWTFKHLDIFEGKKREIIAFFQQKFKDHTPLINSLRKSVVHNDANDNNVVVSQDTLAPKVHAIIDYGDAIYTSCINDLAVAAAYAIMDHNNPLEAIKPLIQGYHSVFKLQEEELAVLYTLIAARLVISVTKSAINRIKEPDNTYLLISEKPAWALLEKWYAIAEDFATYSFREACGYPPCPKEQDFILWAEKQHKTIQNLFGETTKTAIHTVDLSVSSPIIGTLADYTNAGYLTYQLEKIKNEHSNSVLTGGYLEPRCFYTGTSFERESNLKTEYRSMHLGLDFWLEQNTPVHALFKGKVYKILKDQTPKGYGYAVILEHYFTEDKTFYTLYGHVSSASIAGLKEGDVIAENQIIARIADRLENGNWPVHLHFQLFLHPTTDFLGVCYPSEKNIWASICPNPSIVFKKEQQIAPYRVKENEALIAYRKTHLGKSLSLSYNTPLQIVRGQGVYLIDALGQKYMDTVNNVAHVGHEHPKVVAAGQAQMAVLNTNTRYLNENLNDFAKALLATFPKALSVVHFVNSGSEANELALRMVQTNTGAKDMITLELGYHGNTGGCIGISSYKFDSKAGDGAPEHTHVVPLPDTFRGIYTDENASQKYAAHIQEKIDDIHQKGRKLGGFIAESIVSCAGQVPLPDGYLKEAYTKVRQAGGLCISDEVQVGCARMGTHFWGFEKHGVLPDIVTIGKPLGNGHPLAAVVCTQEVATKFANGMEYFNTFGGNPVSCAIGTAVLQTIKQENLQQNALEVGNYLIAGLKKLQQKHPIIADIRGSGLFLGFELTDAQKKPLKQKANYLVKRMKDFGVLMSTEGPDDNILKIKPPIVFSKANADTLLQKLTRVFLENYMQ